MWIVSVPHIYMNLQTRVVKKNFLFRNMVRLQKNCLEQPVELELILLNQIGMKTKFIPPKVVSIRLYKVNILRKHF